MEFDEETSRRVEALYKTVDVVDQRRETLRLLNLQPGEAVLDIGSGPGLLAAEIANIVGPKGTVRGVDISESMLAMASGRCEAMPWVKFEDAGATQLPFEDGAFDAVVTVQVLEYVEDIETALAEIYRVLRPGGRALVIDSDMGTILFNTADYPRMAKILAAWNEHMAHPYLPRVLAPGMRGAGFSLADHGVIPLLNTEYAPYYFSYPMAGMIAAFVTGRQGITEDEAQAWAGEQKELGEAGEYFYSMNRYYFLGEKPV